MTVKTWEINVCDLSHAFLNALVGADQLQDVVFQISRVGGSAAAKKFIHILSEDDELKGICHCTTCKWLKPSYSARCSFDRLSNVSPLLKCSETLTL